ERASWHCGERPREALLHGGRLALHERGPFGGYDDLGTARVSGRAEAGDQPLGLEPAHNYGDGALVGGGACREIVHRLRGSFEQELQNERLSGAQSGLPLNRYGSRAERSDQATDRHEGVPDQLRWICIGTHACEANTPSRKDIGANRSKGGQTGAKCADRWLSSKA